MLLTQRLPPGASRAEQHQTAYALLERALGLEHPEYARTPGGKPYLPARPEVEFSLTHCDGLAACLIAFTPCGVDAERIRPLRERVLRRAFTKTEQVQVLRSPHPDETFFRLWTLKESFVKATGDGLSYGLHKVPVILGADGTICCTLPGWTFHQAVLEDGFVISTCLSRGTA